MPVINCLRRMVAIATALGVIAGVPGGAIPDAVAATRACTDLGKLRSQTSTPPTTITFVNTSGMYRSIDWIDFTGQRKDYGGLGGNETKTFKTFAGHVWVISTGPGDCLQVFVAERGPTTVEVPRMAVDGPRPAPQKGPVAVPAACAKHFTRRGGACVPTASTCKPTEVYSSSMAQCVPIATTCSPGEVYEPSKRTCVARKAKRCPRGQYLNQNGVCQPNETGS